MGANTGEIMAPFGLAKTTKGLQGDLNAISPAGMSQPSSCVSDVSRYYDRAR